MNDGIVKKLYWKKYRPKNIAGVILLPRIQEEILNENGDVVLSGNYIFTGSSGLGKSTLANVIIPEDALIVNASFNSSVEDLKETVIDYCRTGDIFGKSTIDGYKIVFLDEFDGVSAKYQEALRGFIEEFDDRIRFIATCNNISKLSSAILSRFNVIKFDPENETETKYLKEEYLERCNLIVEKNNLNITEEQVISLINTNFPDLRSTFNTLQRVEKIGHYNKELNSSTNVDLYNIIFGDINTEKTYAWVIENFGDNVETLVKMCGRPLCRYILDENKKYIGKIPALTKLFKDYSYQLSSNLVDPVVLIISYIFEIQELINNK